MMMDIVSREEAAFQTTGEMAGQVRMLDAEIILTMVTMVNQILEFLILAWDQG